MTTVPYLIVNKWAETIFFFQMEVHIYMSRCNGVFQIHKFTWFSRKKRFYGPGGSFLHSMRVR